TSRSIKRESSMREGGTSSRGSAAWGGYNSSCKMDGAGFRAISSGQLSLGIAEPSNYNFILK
ncbi:MAG TPA: hypothetical protein VMF10_14155, partial [Candidatus Aquilonibacter sp.]|nr:hypothetical protein [Candidatus Aquilonibacter sp.]